MLVEKVVHGTESGLVLSDTVKDNSLFDIVVVDVGPKCENEISTNDFLVCADGVRALPAGEMKDHYLIHETDIVGIEKVNVSE